MKKGISRNIFIHLMSLSLVAFVVSFGTTPGAAATPQEELVAKARDTVASFHFDPNLDWFHKHVKEAKAVLILPRVREGAIVAGYSAGKGVLLVQNEKTGLWSHPAFYKTRALSLGVKVGGQVSEVVVMVMTKRGIDAFLKDSFKIGTDLKAVIGPGTGTARTPKGDLITFGRSKGLILGTSLVGANVSIDQESNEAYYKRSVTPKDIVLKDTVSNAHALPLRVGITESAKELEPSVTTKGRE